MDKFTKADVADILWAISVVCDLRKEEEKEWLLLFNKVKMILLPTVCGSAETQENDNVK